MNRKLNKWKVSFWICLTLLITSVSLGAYIIIDQAVAMSYHKADFSNTEADLETLIELINETDFSKEEIKLKLKDHRLFEFMNFEQTTVSLEKLTLHFENNSLKMVEK